MMQLGSEIRGWEEHEDPAALLLDMLADKGITNGAVALDPQTRFFTFDGLRRAGNRYDFVNGKKVTAGCRARKSAQEIAIMQYANEITVEVHRSVAAVLHEGMTSRELRDFAVSALQIFGGVLPGGLFLFGPATAYPHGVPYVQTLAEGDMVLVDMSCELGGYRSDITRSYVYGSPNERQRFLWIVEQEAQKAAFEAAKPGTAIEEIDYAARRVLAKAGFSSDYATPGLPHRVGHGIGMEVHEEEYIVRGNRTGLAEGMCFTIEPTISIYGECGVRLEDCAYMTADGAHWFTEPAKSVDDPFGLDV
jgi:Xaa-Pro dipeptidase